MKIKAMYLEKLGQIVKKHIEKSKIKDEEIPVKIESVGVLWLQYPLLYLGGNLPESL